MLETIPNLRVNTVPADALAPKVTSAPAGKVLALYDRQHVLLFTGYDLKRGHIFCKLKNNSSC